MVLLWMGLLLTSTPNPHLIRLHVARKRERHVVPPYQRRIKWHVPNSRDQGIQGHCGDLMDATTEMGSGVGSFRCGSVVHDNEHMQPKPKPNPMQSLQSNGNRHLGQHLPHRDGSGSHLLHFVAL